MAKKSKSGVLGDSKLQEGLMADVSKAEGQSKAFSEGTGIAQSEDYSERVGQVAQKTKLNELIGASKSQIEKVAKQLTMQANLADDVEASKMQSKISQQLNQMRMYAIKQAAFIQRQMTMRGIDEKKQQALLSGLGSIFETGASLAIQGIGSKTTENLTMGAGDFTGPTSLSDTVPTKLA